MISLFASFVPKAGRPSGRSIRGVSSLIAVCALSSAVFAQTETAPAPAETTPAAAGADGGGRRNNQNREGGGNRGNFNPEEMQQRAMARLREQFEVTDDAEWAIILERINKVSELRAGQFGFGGGAFRVGQGGGAGGGGGNRGGRAANPEQDALRQALADKLPEAEITARLTRLRDVRKQTQEKLTKAQEELRAVLNVRQEAVAVMTGMLP